MIDTTEHVAVAAPGTASKPKRSRGLLNKAHMKTLNKAEDVCRAAEKEDYAAPLAAREISAEYVSDLTDDASSARAKAGEAIQHSTAAKTATASEFKAAHQLLAALQEVQKAAKQKYARTNRIALADYFVGKKLNGNRPNLMQTSQSILDKVSADTLPGITAAKVTKLRNLRATWITAHETKGASTSAAQVARAELRTMVKSIDDRKATIQLAADAQWPHTDEENAGIRREFGLSPRQPYVA